MRPTSKAMALGMVAALALAAPVAGAAQTDAAAATAPLVTLSQSLTAAPLAPASPERSAVLRGADKQRGVARLRFDFDNGQRLRAGSRVRNDAGAPHGVVKVADGGRLKSVRGVRGKAARFPAPCCGSGLIEVADRRSLDPRTRKFTFGAAVNLTAGQQARNSNVMQKGYYRQAGGQYKLQLDYGRPSCVVYGAEGRVKVFAGRRIPAKQWVRITCKRTATAVVLKVDGSVWGRAGGRTGSIVNAAPVRIGAKRLGAAGGREQYHGRLDNVFIKVSR